MNDMTPEFLAQEKERFNALSQEEAKAIGERLEGSPPQMRSCWYCNGAHEHLKDTYFTCFACGITFIGGYPAPIFGMRLRGDDIDDATMQQFATVLREAD